MDHGPNKLRRSETLLVYSGWMSFVGSWRVDWVVTPATTQPHNDGERLQYANFFISHESESWFYLK